MIYIVIPILNRLRFTIDCLDSLIQQSYRFYKIILVDHGSTDGSYNFLLAHYPDIIILKGESTLWWTGATNLGVKKAIELSTSTDDFILTLNNDLVVGHNYLEEILNVFISGKPCIVGSVSVNIKENLKVEFAGLKWNNITAKYSKPKEFKSDLSDLLESSLWIESDLLPGRGTLIPLIAFKQIGLFDEYNFPHYAADEDFSLRCKKNGYRLLVSTKSIVKSHIDESGIEVKNRGNMRKKNLILLFQSFKSLKSGINLKIRFNWARKNTPFPHLYFMFDLIRIVFSFYFK